MDFRVTLRDGPARIGQLTLREHKVSTPNILYLQTTRYAAPEFSEILLTNQEKTNKPSLSLSSNIFSHQEKRQKNNNATQTNLRYPKDVSRELLLSEGAQTVADDFCILPAREDIIDDIVQNSKSTIFIIGNAVQLLSHQSSAVDFLCTLRERIGYQRLIYLPCAADPTNMAFLCYMGVDLFDSFSAVMAARNDTLLFPTGPQQKTKIPELFCSCPSCSSTKNAALMTTLEILHHNYYALHMELKQVKSAITNGCLRELVEIRVKATPLFASMLRILDMDHYLFLEERTALLRKSPLIATSKDALIRPEIQRFQQRVLSRYQKPACTRILLLLPCSAKKPYSFSKSHLLFRERLQASGNPGVVHELIITSPLGLVPRELELTSPACCYDSMVTGVWDEDEKKIIRTLLTAYLKTNIYDRIIVHLPKSIQEFTADVLHNAIFTCKDTPTSQESLGELSRVLQETTHQYKRVEPAKRASDNIRALACYQFGRTPADRLLKDCSIKGKYPYQKIVHKNQQLGMLTQERGLLSLTLQGAERFVGAENHHVEIAGDFTLKGSVFTPGILTADESLRIGDEVIIIRDRVVCGVGVALMNGKEMMQLPHGEAIKLRHHS